MLRLLRWCAQVQRRRRRRRRKRKRRELQAAIKGVIWWGCWLIGLDCGTLARRVISIREFAVYGPAWPAWPIQRHVGYINIIIIISFCFQICNFVISQKHSQLNREKAYNKALHHPPSIVLSLHYLIQMFIFHVRRLQKRSERSVGLKWAIACQIWWLIW